MLFNAFLCLQDCYIFWNGDWNDEWMISSRGDGWEVDQMS